MATITRPQVTAALKLSDSVRSKLTETQLEVYGQSSHRLKAFINNICSKDGTKYLEIGVGRGSTILSAVYANETCEATGIENYMYDEVEPTRVPVKGAIWYNMQSQLKNNINRFANPNVDCKKGTINIIEKSFEELLPEEVPEADVVFFDVVPVDTEVYASFFEKIVPYISGSAIIIFSNFSNQVHAEQIREAFENNKGKVKVLWEESRITNSFSDNNHYYSGMGIFGIVKKHIAVGK